jgi:hypothetical protein
MVFGFKTGHSYFGLAVFFSGFDSISIRMHGSSAISVKRFSLSRQGMIAGAPHECFSAVSAKAAFVEFSSIFTQSVVLRWFSCGMYRSVVKRYGVRVNQVRLNIFCRCTAAPGSIHFSFDGACFGSLRRHLRFKLVLHILGRLLCRTNFDRVL